MSRIRSVHPGLFTDEAFVNLSDAARVFFIGLLTEADDRGVFEWKPKTLKMKLRPADDGDVSALLEEIARENMIRQFEDEGRSYGLVRNFVKFQRPKKPAFKHPFPNQFRTFVGYSAESSEPVPHQFPTSGEPVPHQFGTSTEFAPQMEDGGGRREEEIDDDGGSAGEKSRLDAWQSVGRRVLDLIGVRFDDPKWFGAIGRVRQWLADGCDPDLDIYPAVQAVMAKRNDPNPPGSLNYFDRAIAQTHASRTKSMPEVTAHDQQQPYRRAHAPQPTPDDTRAAIRAGIVAGLADKLAASRVPASGGDFDDLEQGD